MEEATPTSIETVLTTLESVFTFVMGCLTTLVDLVMSQPLLLIPIGITLSFVVVKFFKYIFSLVRQNLNGGKNILICIMTKVNVLIDELFIKLTDYLLYCDNEEKEDVIKVLNSMIEKKISRLEMDTNKCQLIYF